MVFWLAIFIGTLFLGTVLFGAPFVPTKASHVKQALNLLDLKSGQSLVELGAGDGRLLKAAARRGWQAIGYEINPLLWLLARIRTWPERHLVSVRLGNYKLQKWPEEVHGIYLFGSHRETKFIARRLADIKRPVTVVSYGFALPKSFTGKSKGAFYVYRLR